MVVVVGDVDCSPVVSDLDASALIAVMAAMASFSAQLIAMKASCQEVN